MSGMKSLIGLVVAAGMMIYAVPRLEIGGGWSLSTIFSLVWIGVALLIVAGYLHDLLGVSEEERQEIRRIHRMRQQKSQQWISRKMGHKQLGK